MTFSFFLGVSATMRKSQRFGIFAIIGFGKLPTVGWEGGTSVFLRLDTFDTDLLWACVGPHVGGYFGSCGVCVFASFVADFLAGFFLNLTENKR